MVSVGSLPLDVVAHMLLFVEPRDVFHSVGVSCLQLHADIWQQTDFWLALGGPLFVQILHEAGSSTLSSSLAVGPVIGAFRRWVFGIEGSWSQGLLELADHGTPFEALSEVLSLTQGLCEGDAPDHDIWGLTKAAVIAMRRSTSCDKDSCRVATLLVRCCQKRPGVFDSAQLAELTSSLGSLQERVLQQDLNFTATLDTEQGLTFDHWDVPGSDTMLISKEMSATSLQVGGQQGKCLALSFLAVLEEH